MKYKPMTDDDWIEYFGDDASLNLRYDFFKEIEQAVLARIEQQGLVIVPREPTHAMLLASARSWTAGVNGLDVQAIRYKAMIDEATKDSP